MLVQAKVWTVAKTEQGNAVLIRPNGSDIAVPIFIGPMEAQSILLGLGKVPMPRPMTHDLMTTILDKLNVKIVRIEITELKNETFFAVLVLKTNHREITVDSRPSDALCIAVRKDTPIFIDEDVVGQAGIPVSTIMEARGEAGMPDLDLGSQKEELQKALEKALEDENYEEAARLRDLLKDLE